MEGTDIRTSGFAQKIGSKRPAGGTSADLRAIEALCIRSQIARDFLWRVVAKGAVRLPHKHQAKLTATCLAGSLSFNLRRALFANGHASTVSFDTQRSQSPQMPEPLTADQMRALEQTAIKSGRTTGLELMERAGRCVIDAICEEWPEFAKTSGRAVVLCGPGNNGGDGFVIGRLLKGHGWQVAAFSTAPDTPMPPDAHANRARWREMDGGMQVYGLDDLGAIAGSPDLIVDALFGIGQDRSADAIMAKVDLWRDGLLEDGSDPPRTVAVDIPTGYDSDTGQTLGSRPFEADLIVTFHSFKPVHAHLKGQGYKSVVKDIGL